MESATMEELFGSFEDKIRNACAKLALLRYYETEHSETIYITKLIASIQAMLYEMRELILTQDQELDQQMKRIAELQLYVGEHIDHIKEQYVRLHLNLKGKPEASKRSPKTPKTPKTPKAPNTPKTPKAPNTPKTPKITAVRSSSPFPQLDPVSHAEFNQIPSYMVGRIALETINHCIESYNLTIAKKYKFIAEYKTNTSNDSDHKRYQAYKALEFVDTKNQHFCTVPDLKENLAKKNVGILSKVLICLRHCKRLREIRGGQDAKTVRYAIADCHASC